MLSLVFVVLSIAFFVVGVVLKHQNNVCSFLRIILVSLCLVTGICIVHASLELTEAGSIDQRIELLQDQNDEIEERLDEAVEAYVDYMKSAKGTEVDVANRMSSIFAIPELQNNAMLQSQLAQFSANEAEILKLEQAKLKIGYYKWLLYFGKEEPKVENVTTIEVPEPIQLQEFLPELHPIERK